MKIKIKISFDKEFYTLNNDDMEDYNLLNEHELIGFFDDIDTAEKAVEKFIEESKGYSLTKTIIQYDVDVDACRIYRKDIPGGFYNIVVYYSLALIE